MDHPGDDPLWYDRVEPDEPPGLLLRLVAALAFGLLAIAGLPRAVLARVGGGSARPKQ